MCAAWSFVLSPYSSLCSLPCVSPISSSSTWTSTCTPSSSMWTSSGQYRTGTPQNEESGPLAENTSHRLWAQAPWWFPLLRDYWNLLPGAIQRCVPLVLAWHGTQWRDHRQSALFTTVHSGARRTSGPKTSLSLLWRMFVAKSSLSVCHVRTENPSMNLVRLVHAAEQNQVATQKMSKSEFSLNDKKSKFSLMSELRSRSTNFKPIPIEDVSRN